MRCLLQIFAIYLIIICLSQILGFYICKKTKIENKYFEIVIGFLSIISLFEIAMLPVMLFHLSTFFEPIILSLIFISILIINYKDIFKIIKSRLKIILCVFTLGVLITIIFMPILNTFGYNATLDDVFYYGRTIKLNSMKNIGVNTIDPNKGENLSFLYSFTGVIHFYSALSLIFNINSHLLYTWLGQMINHSIIVMNIFSVYVFLFKKHKHVFILFLFVELISVFYGNNIIYGFLPTYIRSFCLVYSLPILMLYFYYENNDKKYLYLYEIITISLIACRSSHFFVSLIISFAIWFFEIFFRKNYNFKQLTLISLPVIVYACLLEFYQNNYLLGLIFIFAVLAINLMKSSIKNKPDLIKKVSIFGFLSVLLFIYSYCFYVNSFNPQKIYDSFKYFFEYLEPNIISLIIDIYLLVYSIYVIINRRKFNHHILFLATLILIIYFYFLNPFAMNFVAKYITGSVYNRILGIIHDSMIYILIGININKFIYKLPLILLCAYQLVFNVFGFGSFYTNNYRDYINNFDELSKENSVLYKIGEDSLDIANFFNNYYNDENFIVLYPKEIMNLSLISNNVITSNAYPSFSSNRNEKIIWDDISSNSYEQQLQAVLFRPYYYLTDYFYTNENENVFDLKKALLEGDAQIFIIHKWDSDELNTIYQKNIDEISYEIYENDKYIIYRLYDR